MKYKPKNKPLSAKERDITVRDAKVASGELPTVEQAVDDLKSTSSAMIGGNQVDDVIAAKQMNLALCKFANTLPEEEALAVAAVFPEWELGIRYKVDEYIRHGLNADGEAQLYRVIQAHDSQYSWSPEKVPAMFKEVGFTPTGASIWSQPLGATDAYAKDDVVSHKDVLYVSTINGNVWEPGVYGWTVKP